MEILPETIVDETDSPISGESADVAWTCVASQSNTAFDVAIINWNRLRNGAGIPELAELTDGTFLGRKAMQIVWREGLHGQTVTYVGSELARELAIGVGEIGPGSPDGNTLPSLLRTVSEQSIRWGRPINLQEEMVSGAGVARNYRVLALPFAVAQAPQKLVTVMFDWIDDGLRYSDGYYEIEDAETSMFPDSTILPDTENVLLLEQELASDGLSKLPTQKNANLPYFVVSMAEQQKAGQSPSTEAARGGQGDDNPAQANVRQTRAPAFTAGAGVPEAGGPQDAEPLLLTEVVEPAGQLPKLLLRNEFDLAASLETARDCASAATTSEERSHAALYGAIGAAHDFTLSAFEEPDAYQAMLDAAGLKVQPRAPFTPIVKLVFGLDYDRTRLAEYAAALAHARRMEIPRGCLADHLSAFPGGLKAFVREERQQRRQSGPSEHSQFDRVKDRLRKARPQTFDVLDPGEEEFVLVLARRLPDGGVAMVGKVPEDERLLSRAARAFLSK